MEVLGISLSIITAIAALLVVALWFVIVWQWRPFRAPAAFRFTDAHVLITGGSSGIGKAVAHQCLARGAKVSIIARTQARLDEAQRELELALEARLGASAAAGRVRAFAADVTDSEQLALAVREAVAASGDVDAVVCSAGATSPMYFDDLPIEQFEYQMRVNYVGIVRTVKLLLPSMKQRRSGRFVFVASMLGHVGMFGYTAYAPTKFAVRGFAESLYPEVLPYNIHVSVSYPPDTDTPMYEEEMKLKPLETKKMSESSSVFSPEYVAREIVDGLHHHRFTITHGFDGKILGILGSALQPPSGLLNVLLEVLTLSLLRFVWVFFILSGWFSIALDLARSRTLANATTSSSAASTATETDPILSGSRK